MIKQSITKKQSPFFFGLGAPGLNIISRIAAATLGGYALAHTLPIMLFALLPLPRVEAAMWAAQLSFLIYACTIIWVFAARIAWRAWAGVAVPSVVCGLIAWGLL